MKAEEALSKVKEAINNDNIEILADNYLLSILGNAMEKQIAKKPIMYKTTNRADCPACNATVRGINHPFGDWCSHCGQKLDWSDLK